MTEILMANERQPNADQRIGGRKNECQTNKRRMNELTDDELTNDKQMNEEQTKDKWTNERQMNELWMIQWWISEQQMNKERKNKPMVLTPVWTIHIGLLNSQFFSINFHPLTINNLWWRPHWRASQVLIIFTSALFQNHNGCLHIPNNGHSYRKVPGSMQASSLS